jgi:hypothetical protein
MEAWKVCGTGDGGRRFASLDEEHDPDPRQCEKSDPDPHLSDADPQFCCKP